MLFQDYKIHNKTKVNPRLLWEYNLLEFNVESMRNVVVQRVVERGRFEDFYAILNLYGEEGVKEAIREIPFLNDVDMNFVSIIFAIPLNELKCYTKKQSNQGHWNS